MAREEIRFQFGKFNGDEHWGFPCEILGRDSHGLWLGGRREDVATRGKETFKGWDNYVLLIPDEEWWVARFFDNASGKSVAIYVDITTPTTVNQGEAFTLDLDLDVIKRANGTVEIDDEDEFATHQVQMSYPPRVVIAAREAADTVKQLVESGAAPFDGSHEKWLKKL